MKNLFNFITSKLKWIFLTIFLAVVVFYGEDFADILYAIFNPSVQEVISSEDNWNEIQRGIDAFNALSPEEQQKKVERDNLSYICTVIFMILAPSWVFCAIVRKVMMSFQKNND